MPTEIVEQLEAKVVAMQFSLCSKQKQMQDYFQSSPRAPTPSKEARAPTPTKDVSFKTVADVTKDVSLVDSLDMDDMELESIDTTIASVAASALMKETPTHFSTPKHPHPPRSEPQPSTSMGTGSQPPPKKLKLGLSRPVPKTLKLQACKNSMHTCILNIFDVFDIYTTNYNTNISIIFNVFDMHAI